MPILRRDTTPTRCTPISASIRVCWADLIVISLILLVVAYFLFGIPLTARLFKVLRRKGNDSSPSSSVAISSQHGRKMSPRRQDSQETLFDGLGGDDRLDGMPKDPFLVVQPSLNDSVLVKQGLVEETTLPPPTHSAYDIHGPPSQVAWSDHAFELSSQRSRCGASGVPKPSRGTATSSLKGRMTKETRTGESHEERRGESVPPPPPAYTPFSLGQGRRSISHELEFE